MGDKRSSIDVSLIEMRITCDFLRYSRFYRDSVSQLLRNHPFHQKSYLKQRRRNCFYIIFHVLFIIFVELVRDELS